MGTQDSGLETELGLGEAPQVGRASKLDLGGEDSVCRDWGEGKGSDSPECSGKARDKAHGVGTDTVICVCLTLCLSDALTHLALGKPGCGRALAQRDLGQWGNSRRWGSWLSVQIRGPPGAPGSGLSSTTSSCVDPCASVSSFVHYVAVRLQCANPPR